MANDGAIWSQPSDLDIDHVVALAEAWRSGARNWTTSKRQSLANDLSGPQLIVVTDNVNQAKGDQDPSTWQPPRAGARCAYSKWWIHTKYSWGLHLQSSEKTALQTMLNTADIPTRAARRRGASGSLCGPSAVTVVRQFSSLWKTVASVAQAGHRVDWG